jgi:hypothetical protein
MLNLYAPFTLKGALDVNTPRRHNGFGAQT